ncbi:flagellar hook basal-body protein [Clostridium sp. MD294]|uniref:flagellar hook-basal body protein n=1 Tax=Clostridium sp. MD294 TaxID=97138 RepID=UPI0002C92030|nr:flagellar hook basal-body protein [Clostridium sp. MD294]NDO46411.1 flagellar hook basal-body protein [Clostridium sp. MD294]USF29159.1 Flagellar basal-body rod protein FlgG [Clostridium sp. MD294]
MDRSFYTGAVGAIAHQERLNIIANNIANVNTHGYKNKPSTFSECIYSNLNAVAQEPTDYIAGAGVHVEKTNVDFTQGHLSTTGLEYDYMIMGDGFFAIQNPATQEITYTRNGNFMTSLQPDGNFYLQTANGKRVLDVNQNPIIVGTLPPTAEGGIPGSQEMIAGEDLIEQIGIYTFPSKNGMESVRGTEFIPAEKDGQPVVTAGNGTILANKALEMSNVNLGQEVTKMIEAQRCYQYALRMVQTSDEVETTINGLRS